MHNLSSKSQLLFSDKYLAAHGLTFDTELSYISSHCLRDSGLTFNLGGYHFTFDAEMMTVEETVVEGRLHTLVGLKEDNSLPTSCVNKWEACNTTDLKCCTQPTLYTCVKGNDHIPCEKDDNGCYCVPPSSPTPPTPPPTPAPPTPPPPTPPPTPAPIHIDCSNMNSIDCNKFLCGAALQYTASGHTYIVNDYCTVSNEKCIKDPIYCNICPSGSSLVEISDNIKVCRPNVCDAYICPASIGSCSGNYCYKINKDKKRTNELYKNIETTPVAVITDYCNLNTNSCGGKGKGANRFNNNCNTNESYLECIIRQLKKTFPSNHYEEEITGVAAVPPAIWGITDYNSGGEGLSNNTNICYKLSSTKNGALVTRKIAITDYCGGYCSCNCNNSCTFDGSATSVRGDCNSTCGDNKDSIVPACPAIGDIDTNIVKQFTMKPSEKTPGGGYSSYGTSTTCCGRSVTYGGSHCSNSDENWITNGGYNLLSDWCSSSNHTHFDLDVVSRQHLCLQDSYDISTCILDKVEPVKCV